MKERRIHLVHPHKFQKISAPFESVHVIKEHQPNPKSLYQYIGTVEKLANLRKKILNQNRKYE